MATTTNDSVKDESDINTQRGENPNTTRSYFQVMHSYGREIFFLLTAIFTGIAALQSGPLKTRKANPPEIFFEPPSLVTDFYTGNFRHFSSLIFEKDVSLVMFYAPWDASSMQTRNEFETVAKFYHNEVFFAAINCWWPEGECRKKYSIASYPLVVSIVHEIGTIRYDGPLVSTYIISFLDSILSPIVPLHHSGELIDLFTKHEGVLVAYFEFKGGLPPPEYAEYYTASLRALSTDPFRRICFAVITNKNEALNFKLKSNYTLFLWNSTETYFGNSSAYFDILSWTYQHLRQVSEWITPPGSKSSILSESIENKPTLILFTPRNLLVDHSPYYSLFKEIALDYNNCKESSFVESIIHRMVLKRHVLQEDFSKTIEKCHNSDSYHDPGVCRSRPDLCDLTCCQTKNIILKLNQACSCRACLHHMVKNIQDMKLSECENTLSLVLEHLNIKELGNFKRCSDIEVSFPVKFGQYKQLSFHCEAESADGSKYDQKRLSEKEISQLKDDLILTMIENNEKRLCHRLRYALNYSELNFPDFPVPSDTAWLSNFTGLKCNSNRTLAFIALDVTLYYSFAESLGIDVSKTHHQTTAVIVETDQENQFVLKEQVTKKALVEFIKNYTAGSLNRHLRMPVRRLGLCKKDEDANVCVEEVTTTSFFDVVMEERDVVLMYYAPWCGPCQSISHIYLSVADYFSNVEDIKFCRINGEENDLPWEYTVEKYPTIIFFPAHGKSESVEFPAHLSISMTNLLHFVLVHTQPKVRWTVAMEMCNRDCIAHNLIMSAKEMRRLYRELRLLTNDLHFAQQLIYKPSKLTAAATSPQKGVRPPSVNYLRTVYLGSVVERIHKKRRQIGQALQLQVILRRKRDVYLQRPSRTEEKAETEGDSVQHGSREKMAKDEL